MRWPVKEMQNWFRPRHLDATTNRWHQIWYPRYILVSHIAAIISDVAKATPTGSTLRNKKAASTATFSQHQFNQSIGQNLTAATSQTPDWPMTWWSKFLYSVCFGIILKGKQGNQNKFTSPTDPTLSHQKHFKIPPFNCDNSRLLVRIR